MCRTVTIIGDLEPENTESFFLTLTSQDANVANSNVGVVISDDDRGKVII